MVVYDKVAIIILVIYIVVFLCAEVVMFSKLKLSITGDDLINEKNKLKKQIALFAVLVLLFPVILVLLKFSQKKIIPLIYYIFCFFSVSFGLSLSAFIYKYILIAKKKNDAFPLP